MTAPKDAARHWVEDAIRETRPSWHPDDVNGRAAELHAIAVDYDVPVEELVKWVHEDGYNLSPESWTAHCLTYTAFRARYCAG